MKNTDFLFTEYQALDIPKSIELGLLGLYGIDDLSHISERDRKKLFDCHNNFFKYKEITDYSSCSKEYAIFYLPVNFYKIWRPLLDLLEKNQIKTNCKVLELGSGPGSTTLGFLEFYRQLALRNSSSEFNIEMTLVESEIEFILIFQRLYSQYKKDLPINMKVYISIVNERISSFFDSNDEKYDCIIESNLFNPNENIENLTINYISHELSTRLKKSSSIILIEPAKKELNQILVDLKLIMTKYGMNVYSPCSCDMVCKQFPLACIDVSHIKLLSDLNRYNVINASKQEKGIHYFEYVVFRNDGLQKSCIQYAHASKHVKLCELGKYIGQCVSFKAYIIYFKENDSVYSLKVCDGSMDERNDIWVAIPKILFNESIAFTSMGRGGIVYIRDATVKDANKICCELSTKIRMER